MSSLPHLSSTRDAYMDPITVSLTGSQAKMSGRYLVVLQYCFILNVEQLRL